MDPKVSFWFYLVAVICFVLAAAGDGTLGGLGRRGVGPRLALVPLGLALFAFPTLWAVGTQAF